MKTLAVILCFTFLGCFFLPESMRAQLLSPDAEESGGLDDADEGYIIGCSDILEIMTWKEADFSKKAVVRNDGKITFPLLDDIQAAGRTPIALKHEIENRLQRYLSKPIVTVTVVEPKSKKFYILGEVERIDQYDLVKNLKLLQAIALAGGFTEWASRKNIVVIRQEGDKERIIRLNYKEIVKNNDYSQNILIKENDTIIVP